MENMKCPFCGQKLDTSNYYVRCNNPHCNITAEMEGTEEMWKEIIRIKKSACEQKINSIVKNGCKLTLNED